MKTELGGDRLGSGNKQEISLKNYSRSTHDLGYVWRSSMASGTLVPFMSEVALPGDSFDIDLDCDVKTLPTVGPLFGSYKVQLDVFECPIRLYQGKLHMNMLNIGMDMSEVLLPQINMYAFYTGEEGDNTQINSSSIYSYLNMRGLGRNGDAGTPATIGRKFNAVPYLGYWDIYKNYYANKQEERGFVIHAANLDNNFEIKDVTVTTTNAAGTVKVDITGAAAAVDTDPAGGGSVETSMTVTLGWNDGTTNAYGTPVASDVKIEVDGTTFTPEQLFSSVVVPEDVSGVGGEFVIECSGYLGILGSTDWENVTPSDEVGNTVSQGLGQPQLTEFDLDNIDGMRMDILEAVRDVTAFEIDNTSAAPYGLGLGLASGDWWDAYKLASQEGLGIKTYQSDLFNNWISTEWIDGTGGVAEVTAVDTTGNEFTIDALNLANKVYNMLNRIAISGGSYDDWLDAVYTHERSKSCESRYIMEA